MVGRPRKTPPIVAGNPGTLAEILRGDAQLAIGHVQVVLDPDTLAGVEAFRRVLEVLDRR